MWMCVCYGSVLCRACGFLMCLYTTNKCFVTSFSLFWRVCVCVCLSLTFTKPVFDHWCCCCCCRGKLFFSANNGKSFQHFEAVLCCNSELFSVDSVSLSNQTSPASAGTSIRTNTQTNNYAQTHRRHTYKQRE